MRKFFSFIIRQSVAVILAVVFVLAFGVYATLKMPINLLPDINVPMVCVLGIYPGANAQSVDKDVTDKMESGLSSIAGVTNVDSYSYDNLAAIVLSFNYGTDTDGKKADIQSKLSSIDLPSDVTTTVYDIDLNAEALAVLSVTGEGASEKERLENAYEAAQELSERISAIDGVERVEIKGGEEKFYTIKPFGGLELISPLLVQAFSYGALDIPLGNVMGVMNGKFTDVQVRNNSDIEKYEDIENMPVSLPAQIVTLLTSVKQIINYYEDSSEQDLKDLQSDLNGGVLEVLGDLDELTADELDDLATLKTYMNIANTYTAEQLKSFKRSRYYKEIYERVTNAPAEEGGERTPKTDDELEDLLNDIEDAYPALSSYITMDMLKVVRDGKIDTLIAYREEYVEDTTVNPDYDPDEFYELTNDDYFVLETRYVQVYSGVYDYTAELSEVQKQEIYNNIDFAKKTSATGLSNIADKKRDAEETGESYSPTDSECALLFTGTELSSEHAVVMSPTFMAFVRADSYEENMATLISTRAELHAVHYSEETEEESPITAEEYFALYESLDLKGVFEFKLSEKLLNFIINADFSELADKNYVVAVKDIAEVERDGSYTSYVYFGDGKAQIMQSAIIEVYKSNGANSSSVVGEVKSIYAKFAAERGENQPEIEIKLLDDQSEFISDSISNVLVSMLIGGLLAVLIIFMFLKKARTSLIIAITMPLSVLAALICLFVMGITLNMVSLGGLAVGIGMLVDNSIVVIESISKHRDAGKSAFEAAVDGTTEVGGALFGSTVTTVCVFIPIIFSGGLTGEIFTDLSWAVIFSLTFSLIVAVSVIPALYAMFNGRKRMLKGGKPDVAMCAAQVAEQKAQPAKVEEPAPENTESEKPEKPKKDKKSFKEKFAVLKEPKIMNGILSGYGKILPAVLNKKLVTIITAIAIFGASIGLLFLTGTEFLPSIDKGQIEISLSYGSGENIDNIQKDVSEFALALQDGFDDKDGNRVEAIENIDYISLNIGKNGMLALTDTGIITVQLTTNRGTENVVNQIRDYAEKYSAKENVIGRSVTVRQIDGVVASLMSGADDLSVTVVGSNGETLKEIAQKIGEKFYENGFKDVKNSSTDKSLQYTLKFDRTKMAEMGLDYQTVVLTLRIGIASYTACSVKIDGKEYNVNVQFNEDAFGGEKIDGETIISKEDLENFVVGAQTDDGTKAVKLKDILKGGGVIVEETETCIRRTGGKQMVSISAAKPGVDTGAAGSEMQRIAAEVLKNYEGYSFEQSGISSYLNEAFSGLAVALVISFFLLYAVMAVQFGSALKPLIIMASIPFSFTGGFIALVITGTSLNVVSFIGLIMLMGVVVNNAIVMLEKIKQLEKEGQDSYIAVQNACKERLRPILMTTLTTILALIPLAIGLGQGSELMQPLGIVVIGGLLIGTLVTLVLVPAVYCAVRRVSKKYPAGKRAAKRAKQAAEKEKAESK